MGSQRIDACALVQPGRVHRTVYTDPEVFEQEIARIFGRAWCYVGHESQVPEAGDFFTTKIANQPVAMVRQADGSIKVLHNRCAHRGAEVVGKRCGTARVLRCCYHGWTYATDGTLIAIPRAEGYEKTGIRIRNPQFSMPALRSTSYRGFVFASLARDGPELIDFLGVARHALDNMVDRSPESELEVAGGCFRIVLPNNWKIYLENLHDGMHPMVVHQSSIAASRETVEQCERTPGEKIPFALQIVAANDQGYDEMRQLEVVCDEHGHSVMRGFREPTSDDPVFEDYMSRLEARHGRDRAAEILSTNFHNVSVYPSASAHPSFLQIRALFPLSVERTLMEIWTLRLKGAPEELHRRNIVYANTVHSPSSIIKPDDLEAYRRVQAGAYSKGGDWMSQHRDWEESTDDLSGSALSEHYVRNQYRAWLAYMSAAAAE